MTAMIEAANIFKGRIFRTKLSVNRLKSASPTVGNRSRRLYQGYAFETWCHQRLLRWYTRESILDWFISTHHRIMHGHEKSSSAPNAHWAATQVRSPFLSMVCRRRRRNKIGDAVNVSLQQRNGCTSEHLTLTPLDRLIVRLIYERTGLPIGQSNGINVHILYLSSDNFRSLYQ